MKYRVIVTPEAQTGIRESFEYIHTRAPLNAARWLQGLYSKIDTLERLPERCAYAGERRCLDQDLRQLLFKPYRIVFKVDKKSRTVWALFGRHDARRAASEQPADNHE